MIMGKLPLQASAVLGFDLLEGSIFSVACWVSAFIALAAWP